MFSNMDLPQDLQESQVEIEEYAREVNLDFPEVRFVMLDFRQMNQVAAYDGFPSRYPHWRFGMEYDRLSKSYAWGLHRIYEMVINTDPCYAYLLTSNLEIDQRLVMAHVYGHADFFKNNYWFDHTNRQMLDEMANHSTRIRRYIEQFGMDEVESFIDRCLSIENLIDIHAPAIDRPRSRPEQREDEDEDGNQPNRLPSKGYMDTFINPPDYMDSLRQQVKEEKQLEEKFPSNPQKDVLNFLLSYAPLKPWQQDILSMIREENLYFVPQRQTKIMNEGWACAVGDTLVHSDQGLVTLEELVEEKLALQVHDGEAMQAVYDWAKFENEPTVRMTTSYGLALEGSVTHRVRLADGTWRRLDELAVGDEIEIAHTVPQWPSELERIRWEPEPVVEESSLSRLFDERTLKGWDSVFQDQGTTLSFDSDRPQIPDAVNPEMATFLGYLAGKGGQVDHAEPKLSLTACESELTEHFASLAHTLFGLDVTQQPGGSGWQVEIESQSVVDALHTLAITEPSIPTAILRSPKPVVSAFLSAYFDMDGFAGNQGIILNTASDRFAEQIQLLLLNFGIRSQRFQNHLGSWQLQITASSASLFVEEIGFGLERKQATLQDYLESYQAFNPRGFAAETWTDTVVLLEEGVATVYDISVENSHRYAANGLINHNSYWHSNIMTRRALRPHEMIDYADHHSGTLATSPGRINPYKLGIELFKDIEDRWNRGAFGPDYEACKDQKEKAEWDLKLGLGREKIFEVRKIFNDIGFIDTFLTPEFVKEQKMFQYRYNPYIRQYEIESRSFEDIKQQLLLNLTNFGDPYIVITDANYMNRGELYLLHHWEETDLRFDYAQDTLENLQALWQRPVHLETAVADKGNVLLSYDGSRHISKLISEF